MKSFIIRFILLLFVAVSAFSQQKEITLLYTNDIESVYESVEAFWNDDIELIGGIPYLATLIKQTRAKEKISFLFDAGDIFTGALSQSNEGVLAFDVYSQMSYDALNLGNHEFEYGHERLREVWQRANFPVLCANIFYENTDIHFADAYTIVRKDDFKIGVIGIMGVDAFLNTMSVEHRQGLEVRDPIPIVQDYINLIHDDVDLIVVLTHQNRTAPMQTDKEADPEVQRGFDEDYEMAGKVEGIDVLLGGHSDNGLWEPVKHPDTGTLIGLTFGQGKYLGYLKLLVDKENDSVELKDGKLIPVESAKLNPDEKILNLIEDARAEAEELTKVVGEIDKFAYRKYYEESNLGNLLTDILKECSGADIAIMNSGSLRADLNPGEITIEELINVYPFIGKFHVVEISGEGVRELLEHSYGLAYGYCQMSGVEAVYNSENPKGERLIEASINGKPIMEDKKYTVTSSAFLAHGGDRYKMLADGRTVKKSDKRMIDYFIEYFRKNKKLTVPDVGRQVDISKAGGE